MMAEDYAWLIAKAEIDRRRHDCPSSKPNQHGRRVFGPTMEKLMRRRRTLADGESEAANP